MDRQPGQMTIWLLVPSGLPMGHELAAVLIGSVAALSSAVAVTDGTRSERGSLADHPDRSPRRLVRVAPEPADGGALAAPWSANGSVGLSKSVRGERRG
jgi:hypothetical protein